MFRTCLCAFSVLVASLGGARCRCAPPRLERLPEGPRLGPFPLLDAESEPRTSLNLTTGIRRLPPPDTLNFPAQSSLPPDTFEWLPKPPGESSFSAFESPNTTTVSNRVFPNLPPDPNAPSDDLPSLEDELWLHGGAHLYVPEGDGFYTQQQCGPGGHEPLRLPEDWQAPQPFTLFADFLGADPVRPWPALHWPGAGGYAWEPRGVVYGVYQLFGFAFQEGGVRQDAVGHQLLLDFDLRLTGTERLHVQYRPIGEMNTGGSFYQFTAPVGYVDNSTGVPDRYWIEAELASVLSGWIGDPFTPRDFQLTAGVFPFMLQNNLLMNDDVAGVVVSKNTVYLANLSNLNAQWFYFFDDVDAYSDAGADVFGVNVAADYLHALYELVYAYRTHHRDRSRDTHYAALSATKLCGRMTFAGRAMFKWGDSGGSGDGQLFVLESNWTRRYDGPLACRTGVSHGVYYVNAFCATKGWRPISGGNFDRLRSSFEVNPLVSIARGTLDDTCGAAAGVQWFRRHEDESLTPEVAYEAPHGVSVWGVGLCYQRKTGPRSFFEVNGVVNWSNDPALDRDGVFVSQTILF